MLERITIGVLLVFFAAITWWGCDSCESGGPVPFGLDSGAPLSAPPVTRPRVEHEPSQGVELRVQDYPEGARSAELDGAPIVIEGAMIRSLGAWDFDRDGDRDALVIAVDDNAERRARLWAVRRESESFERPMELRQPRAFSGECAIVRSAIHAMDPSMVRVELTSRCSETGYELEDEVHAIAIGRGPSPRVLERVTLGRKVRDQGGDSFILRTEDRDADGHADLVVDLSFEPPARDSPVRVSLAFLDRPSGFAREPSEPETTIAALAEQARGALRREPERALDIASGAVAIWEALCHESSRARFDVGGARGVSCGRSQGAGRAIAIMAQAAARTGQPLLAVQAAERLRDASISVRPRDREAVMSALSSLGGEPWPIHEGPFVTREPEHAARRSIVGFVDENRILVRDSTPRIFDISSGTEETTTDPAGGALELLAPSAEYRLVGIERRCIGTVLVIESSSASVATTRKTALLAPRRPPPGAPCPDLNPRFRSDDDGWRVLGWAPQGVLVARDLELRLIPLDLEANPLGEPVILERGAAIPAPIAPGPATSDGRAFVYSAPGGWVVVELAPERQVSFVRAMAHGDARGVNVDVAVSPSTRRIAWVADGRVWWLERGLPE